MSQTDSLFDRETPHPNPLPKMGEGRWGGGIGAWKVTLSEAKASLALSEAKKGGDMVRLPSSWIIFFCLLLFGFGELAGALLGGYPQQIKNFIGQSAMAHPEVHGLVGVSDIDRTILNGIEGEALVRVHTFHLHSHGLALVVFVLNLIIVNMGLQDRTKRILHGLTCLGLLYPFGWLMIVFTLPFYGKSGAFHLSEKIFFIPFGGVFLLAVWILILFYLIRTIVSKRDKIMFVAGIFVIGLTARVALAETLDIQTVLKAYESGAKTCRQVEQSQIPPALLEVSDSI